MRRLSLRSVALLSVAFMPLAPVVFGQSPSITYLQQRSDQFQSTVDVYTEADAAGNHFSYRGETDIYGGQYHPVPAMDEVSSGVACHSGFTCITATFDPTYLSWGGWYFMNGVLGAGDRQPRANWGNFPNAGYDLTGATTLQFWAKGDTGQEKVQFFAFGVGAGQFPYPDSAPKQLLGPLQLSTNWTQYSLSVRGLDLHYVLGGFGWVATSTLNQKAIKFYLDDIQFVDPRPKVPRFLVSYETIQSDIAFDHVMRNVSFTYDNAVALIALLAANDKAHAATIANALLYAQSHDRYFSDSRLRNAYQGGDIMLPPGWLPNNRVGTARMPGHYDNERTNWFEDETQVSSGTGNIAWAMLALLYYYETTHLPAYEVAAERLGNWVISNTWSSTGSGGFTAGYDGWENGGPNVNPNCPTNVWINGQCKRLYKSTEHNIDLYSAYSRLFVITRNTRWLRAAQQAKNFVKSMWDADGGKFWTGTLEDGVSINKEIVPTDIQVWAIEALGSEAQPYLSALQYVESNSKTSYGYGFRQNGADPKWCGGDHTWFEGTSQVALAYQLTGNHTKWQSLLDVLHTQQLSDGAMPASDPPCLDTGFQLSDGSEWLYYPRAHVGATAWLSLAEQAFNPFRAELYSPRLNQQLLSVPTPNKGLTATGRLILQNPGTSPLSIRHLALSGDAAADFTVQHHCGATLQPGTDCTIDVKARPQGSGTRQADLHIALEIDSGSGEIELPAVKLITSFSKTTPSAQKLTRQPRL